MTRAFLPSAGRMIRPTTWSRRPSKRIGVASTRVLSPGQSNPSPISCRVATSTGTRPACTASTTCSRWSGPDWPVSTAAATPSAVSRSASAWQWATRSLTTSTVPWWPWRTRLATSAAIWRLRRLSSARALISRGYSPWKSRTNPVGRCSSSGRTTAPLASSMRPSTACTRSPMLMWMSRVMPSSRRKAVADRPSM